jgi:hypothetical protein
MRDKAAHEWGTRIMVERTKDKSKFDDPDSIEQVSQDGRHRGNAAADKIEVE